MKEENVINKINIKNMADLGLFYSIKIKKRKEKEYGVLIQEGKDWLLIKALFSDFILDGYKIINKKYIVSLEQTEDDLFVERVLKSNGKIDNIQLDIPLETLSLFQYLAANKYVIQLSLNKENISYIGLVADILPKSIYLNPLGKKGEWLNYDLLFRVDFIRIIEFNTDYINSLVTYSKFREV